MQKRSSYIPFFIIFFLLSIIIFGIAKLGFLKPVEPIFRTVFAPIQAAAYGSFTFFTSIFQNSKVEDLKIQNAVLIKKLINQDKLIEDNKALRDQFQTQNPKSINLMPSRVIGAPGFIPGISVPESLVIDKGAIDGVRLGDAVIYKDNLVGRISALTEFVSGVELITNSTVSFTAKTLETNALGVVKGQGGGNLLLDNVVLSDNLKLGDIVLSKGDISASGEGFVSDLVVGRISAISKNPSDLFQKAKIKSNIDFSKIDKVFVITSR